MGRLSERRSKLFTSALFAFLREATLTSNYNKQISSIQKASTSYVGLLSSLQFPTCLCSHSLNIANHYDHPVSSPSNDSLHIIGSICLKFVSEVFVSLNLLNFAVRLLKQFCEWECLQEDNSIPNRPTFKFKLMDLSSLKLKFESELSHLTPLIVHKPVESQKNATEFYILE